MELAEPLRPVLALLKRTYLEGLPRPADATALRPAEGHARR